MSDLGFCVRGTKAYVIRNGNEKEIPRDSILEIYQLVLGHIAPNRDYTAVTSIRKLLRIIDLECEPDESDDESGSTEKEQPVAKPAAKPTATRSTGRKPAAPRTVRKPPAKPAAKEESESDDDSDSD